MIDRLPGFCTMPVGRPSPGVRSLERRRDEVLVLAYERDARPRGVEQRFEAPLFAGAGVVSPLACDAGSPVPRTQ